MGRSFSRDPGEELEDDFPVGYGTPTVDEGNSVIFDDYTNVGMSESWWVGAQGKNALAEFNDCWFSQDYLSG